MATSDDTANVSKLEPRSRTLSFNVDYQTTLKM